MARRAAGDWGRSPETAGHERLVKFVVKHSIADLADAVGVKSAVAHAWYWRDARPSQEMIGRLVHALGGTAGEWLTAAEKKAQRDAQKKIRELQKGAA